MINLDALVVDGNSTGPYGDMKPFACLLAGLVIACNAQVVLEIGSGPLNSGRAFLYGLEKTKGILYTCDLKKKFDFSHPSLCFERLTSQELAKSWNNQIDILLIDGDHKYEQVKFDYNTFLPFVKKGGFIVLHDTVVKAGPKKLASEVVGDQRLVFPKNPGLTVFQKQESGVLTGENQVELEETKRIVKSIQGWVGDKEGAYLFQRAKNCSKGIIVEIGSWKGKSTVWLARGSKAGNKTRIYAIDPFDGRDSKFITIPQPDYSVFEIFKDNIRKAGLNDLITPIVSRSQDASDKIKERIEFLFIDGAHGYEFVKKDFELYFPKVLRGGIIVFHDANEREGVKREGVVKLMRELSKDKRVEKIDVVGSMVAWRKI